MALLLCHCVYKLHLCPLVYKCVTLVMMYVICAHIYNIHMYMCVAIPVLNMLEDYREIEKGSSFNISCQVVQGIPQPSLVWTIGQDQATSIEGVSIATDENMSILMFGNITFAHSNKYTCTATNRVGTNSSEVEIKVRGQPGTDSVTNLFGTISAWFPSCATLPLVPLLYSYSNIL